MKQCATVESQTIYFLFSFTHNVLLLCNGSESAV
jgi:hypothetical protein